VSTSASLTLRTRCWTTLSGVGSVAATAAVAELTRCSGMIDIFPPAHNDLVDTPQDFSTTTLSRSYLRKTHRLRKMLRPNSIQMPTVPIYVYAVDNLAARCLVAHCLERGVERHATATVGDLGQ